MSFVMIRKMIFSMRRIAAAAILLSLLLTLCAGCANMEKEKVVTVFSARHYEADTALFEAFTKQTGIVVKEVKGTAEELIAHMKWQGDSSEADLFFTVDGGVLSHAKRDGVLQPMQSEKLDEQVPAYLRDGEHYWIGVATRARVIVYAKDRVSAAELSTYDSLIDEKWRGRLLVRSSSNLYNQSLLASFIALQGETQAERWAKGIAGNLARQPEGGDRDQAIAIADGIGDAAIMNTYYIGQLSVSQDTSEASVVDGLGVIFPNQETTGTHVNISGIGLAKHAKHKQNALKLVEFMTSAEGQTLLIARSFEFPVNDEAEVPELLRSWGTFKAQQIDFADFINYREQAAQIFERVKWQ